MDTQSSVQHVFPLRNLQRVSSILGVLAKHDWGHYLDRLRLKGYLPTAPATTPPTTLSEAEHLRLALEELGPTFVKFGQLLSVRQDLFPDDITRELQKLQDAVPPFPPEEARRIIKQELGCPVSELFAAFDDASPAAASIAQVHAATLLDGTAAIVKELDFRLEGHNAERFSANFKDEPAVYVPRIFRDVSTKRVLTQERSTGHRAVPGYPADTAERRRLAQTLARLFLMQLFEHGYFHGDPHPGNIFIMHDGRLCFHDFGIVGPLSPRDQENLRQLVLAVVTRDAEAMAELYFDMGVAAASVDRDAFVRDLSKALEQYYAVSARAYSFGEILHQFVRIGQRHQIRMPREWLLVDKAFMVIESQASALDPEFSMIEALQRYTPRMLGSHLLPELSTTSGLIKGYGALNALRLIAGLPRLLAKGLRQLENGRTTLRVRHERLDDLEQQLNRASNRLSFSLITA